MENGKAGMILRSLARFGLRTLLATVLSQICAALGVQAWTGLALWLARATHTSQVALDTMALAIPLAVRPVTQMAVLLSLPPIFLACWAASYPVSRRCRAACMALGAGVAAVMMWQAARSLYSGYAFALRYAVPRPVAPADALVIALACGLEAWVLLRALPVRTGGGQFGWFRTGGGRNAV